METHTYVIRRGEGHMPQDETAELRIHGGPKLRVRRGVDVAVELTAEQVRQLEADGYQISTSRTRTAKARKAAAAEGEDTGAGGAKEE